MKKGFALFPILIVLVALSIFNFALYESLNKARKEVKGIEEIMEIIDYKQYSEIFFDYAYNLATSKALFDFTEIGCQVFQYDGKRYFPLECELKKDRFYDMLKENLERVLGVYKDVFSIYDANFNHYCKVVDKNEKEKRKIIECNFFFNKSSNIPSFNATIFEEKNFVREIKIDEINMMVAVKKELEIIVNELKKKNESLGKIEEEIKKFEEKYRIKIESSRCGVNYCFEVFFGKRFLIDEGVYKEVSLRFYISK